MNRKEISEFYTDEDLKYCREFMEKLDMNVTETKIFNTIYKVNERR